MLCQKCGKRQATTYVKTIVNGNLSEFSLCPDCVLEAECGTLLPVFPLNSFIKGFFDDSSEEVERCPKCNMTLQDIVRLGQVGCSNCYQVFYNKLLPSIQRIHGTSVHKGKVPGKSALAVSVSKSEMQITGKSPVELKRRLLEAAIKEQRFEEAAVLRDEIKELEEGIHNE